MSITILSHDELFQVVLKVCIHLRSYFPLSVSMRAHLRTSSSISAVVCMYERLQSRSADFSQVKDVH